MPVLVLLLIVVWVKTTGPLPVYSPPPSPVAVLPLTVLLTISSEPLLFRMAPPVLEDRLFARVDCSI